MKTCFIHPDQSTIQKKDVHQKQDTMEKRMRKIKRRTKKEKEPKPRKLKRRKVTVERLASTGKCQRCDDLYWYGFEGDNKHQIESKPKRAKRFNKLIDCELCLKCLTRETNNIKAYDIMQLWVFRGEGELNFDTKKVAS